MPAARSLWNGTITFGSVVIPVKLFSATSPHTLRFREVRAVDGATIEHRRIGAESGDEIAYADIEKAYDEGESQIVLTKEEIAAAEGTHPKVIAIDHFVAGEEIDPVFYDKPYLVGARDGGDHAYRVLLAALEKTDKVGIGRFVLRSRENLVALRPLGGALGLQTMRFDDELVDKSDLELPSLRKKPGDREVKMAGALVEMLQDEWRPEDHDDTYRDAVMDLIERKRRGQKPKKAKRRPDDGGDLADALEASLKGGKPKAKAKKTTVAERKTKTAGSSSAKTKASSSGSKASEAKGSGSTSSKAKAASSSAEAKPSSTSTSGKASPKKKARVDKKTPAKKQPAAKKTPAKKPSAGKKKTSTTKKAST